jgi:hypothetical protein
LHTTYSNYTPHKNQPDQYDPETWKKEGPMGYVSGVMNVLSKVKDAKTNDYTLYA